MQLPQWARPSSMAVECLNLTFQNCKLYTIVIMNFTELYLNYTNKNVMLLYIKV